MPIPIGDAKRKPALQGKLYTLDVFITSGPITEEFAKKNKVIFRTIEIRGDQTLEDLHNEIFDAFDREEEHLYEFQIGGKGHMDRKAKRYVLPMELEDSFGDRKAAGSVTQTTIGSLGLKVAEAFSYWFDFGDDWWHQIDVVEISDQIPKGKFPRTIKSKGKSPPQYIDWDDEELQVNILPPESPERAK